MLVLRNSPEVEDILSEGPISTEVPGVACQTDEHEDTIKNCKQQTNHKDVKFWNSSLVEVSSPQNCLINSPEMLKFYTGIPDWVIFTALLSLVTTALPTMQHSKLSSFEMVLMFLIKIRPNLFDEDIGYRFSVHHASVSKNFPKVLDVMAVKTSQMTWSRYPTRNHASKLQKILQKLLYNNWLNRGIYRAAITPLSSCTSLKQLQASLNS